MILIHTTPRRNLDSIREYGILCSFSRGARPAVWLHDTWRSPWAETHVELKHDCSGQEIVHIVVEVRDQSVRKHADGLYYSMEDITPSQLKAAQVVRKVLEEVAL